MAFVTCSNCTRKIPDTAPSCPYCGEGYTDSSRQNKSVSLLLGIGIFFMPLIFSWATLREGYTTVVKLISFTWLIIMLVAIDAVNSNDTQLISLMPADTELVDSKPAPDSSYPASDETISDSSSTDEGKRKQHKSQSHRTKY